MHLYTHSHSTTSTFLSTTFLTHLSFFQLPTPTTLMLVQLSKSARIDHRRSRTAPSIKSPVAVLPSTYTKRHALSESLPDVPEIVATESSLLCGTHVRRSTAAHSTVDLSTTALATGQLKYATRRLSASLRKFSYLDIIDSYALPSYSVKRNTPLVKPEITADDLDIVQQDIHPRSSLESSSKHVTTFRMSRYEHHATASDRVFSALSDGFSPEDALNMLDLSCNTVLRSRKQIRRAVRSHTTGSKLFVESDTSERHDLLPPSADRAESSDTRNSQGSHRSEVRYLS